MNNYMKVMEDVTEVIWDRIFSLRIPHGIRHTILRPAFWLGMTIGFPLEHLIWEKLWPFEVITRWLGL